MPARQERHGKIEAHNAVHRHHQRCGQPRQEQVGYLVAMPVARRPAPPHRQHAVDDPAHGALRAVAKRGEVWNETNIPKEQRDGAVGGDGKEVPDQRTAKLRPDIHRIGIWDQPVEKPRAPQVQHGKQPGTGHRE